MKKAGDKASGVAWGILVGIGVAACAYGVMRVSFYFFPGWINGQVPWVAWLLVVVLPEIIFVSIAAAWWRKRRPMAVGVLIPAAMLGVHFAMHIAGHWNQ